MAEEKYADRFLSHVKETTEAIRYGFDGLKELLATKFLWVRNAYTRKMMPTCNNVKNSKIHITATEASHLSFEADVDTLFFYSTTDLYLDGSTNMGEPMVFEAGKNHSVPLRGRDFYMKAVNVAGYVWVWGLY